MIFHPNHKPYHQLKTNTIYQLVKTRAEENADAIAIIAPARPPLTYGRLLQRVESTIEALRAFGVNRNDRVAAVLPSGPAMAVAFVAVGSGATFAPLNPSFRTNELDFYISDINTRALIVWSEA